MFNLYIMRRGVLLVGAGEETKSLAQDIKSMPVLVKDFTILLPDMLIRYTYGGKVLRAIGIFLFFGLAVGTILGVTRGDLELGLPLGDWGVDDHYFSHARRLHHPHHQGPPGCGRSS